MAVKIRLKRMGKIRAPYYRVVVMDSRTKRDGRAIEEIGKYHPTQEPSLIEIDGERAQYWLRQGAQPTESVAALLKVTGDWQQAKGLDGGEGTLRVKAEKTPKRDLYEAALAAAGGSEDQSGSAAPRKKRAEAPKADASKADSSKADAPKTQSPKAEAPKAESPKSPQAEAPKAEAPKAEAAESPQAEAQKSDAGAPANEDGSAPEGYTIKGNQDSMKFHEPDGQWYEQTVAEVWFKTAADAQAAGFVKAGS